MRAAALTVCLAALSLLSGCGFHLRRAPVLPPQLHALYIGGSASTNLMRSLRRNLASDTTTIVDDPTLATATLDIRKASRSSTLLAISRSGQPLEYRVTYRVEFTLMVGNAVLIEPQTLALTRTYNYNIQDAIGNQEQEDALETTMETDLAQLIVFRIQAAAKSALPPVAVPAPAKATVPTPAAATASSRH